MMDYQTERAVEAEQAENNYPFRMATVVARSGYTYTLQFDGDENATTKYYKGNAVQYFYAGDRVVCAKVSGTYVVICKIK